MWALEMRVVKCTGNTAVPTQLLVIFPVSTQSNYINGTMLKELFLVATFLMQIKCRMSSDLKQGFQKSKFSDTYYSRATHLSSLS